MLKIKGLFALILIVLLNGCNSETIVPTATLTQTHTPTQTATNTATPTSTPVVTNTPIPTDTQTPTPTSTLIPTPIPSPTLTSTPTNTPIVKVEPDEFVPPVLLPLDDIVNTFGQFNFTFNAPNDNTLVAKSDKTTLTLENGNTATLITPFQSGDEYEDSRFLSAAYFMALLSKGCPSWGGHEDWLIQNLDKVSDGGSATAKKTGCDISFYNLKTSDNLLKLIIKATP